MTKDKLFHGLPAISYREGYLVFSPYIRKIIFLKEKELDEPETLEELTKKHFFGEPKTKEDDSVRITLSLTDACSMNCGYCFESHKGNKNFMSKDLALSILEKQVESFQDKKFYIHFFGGEPTLNFSVIEEVVKFLEDKKVDSFYRINTNGVVSKKTLEFMVNHNFHLDISCDGPPEIQDLQRPLKKGLSSEYLEKTIKFLAKNEADFKVKSVITRETTKDMPEIVEYLADLGVKLIRLEPIIIHGKAEESRMNSVNPDEFIDYFFRSLEVAKDKKVYVSNWAYRNLLEPQDYFCRVFKSNRIIITPTGIVTKCIQHATDEEKSLFSVGKVDYDKKGDYKLHLDEDQIKNFQSISVENIPKCQPCFAKYICSGGCYRENLDANQSFYEPTENKCEITKKLLRKLIIKLYES